MRCDGFSVHSAAAPATVSGKFEAQIGLMAIKSLERSGKTGVKRMIREPGDLPEARIV